MSQNGLVPDEAASIHRAEHVTYHLVPAEVWSAQMFSNSYEPEGFAQEGFIHCTDTLEELVAVGNRYYRSDAREFLVLAIDCEQVTASVIYEDERQIFPHIYGPLNTDAVLSMRPVVRAGDGTFLSMG
jgi:uncharacterized protein (DUF952 family)